MIIRGSCLNIRDNSGGKKARCIGLYKNAKSATVGDVIRVSVIEVDPSSEMKKGTTSRAVIVSTRYPEFRNGIHISFGDNCVVLIDDKDAMIGTRVLCLVSRIVKDKFPSIVNKAPEVI